MAIPTFFACSTAAIAKTADKPVNCLRRAVEPEFVLVEVADSVAVARPVDFRFASFQSGESAESVESDLAEMVPK